MEDQPTRGASNATGYELSRQVLLRSVAVVPQTPALYLLTTTAERYFPKFRFETIGRTDVATTVQTSSNSARRYLPSRRARNDFGRGQSHR